MSSYNVKKSQNKFIFFILAGSVAACVNFLSRIAFGLFMPYDYSIIFAYSAGMLTGYFLFKHIVFEPSKNTTSQQLFYFILVNIVSALLTLIISIISMDYVFSFMTSQFKKEEVSHLFGISAPIFISFLGHKKWSFR